MQQLCLIGIGYTYLQHLTTRYRIPLCEPFQCSSVVFNLKHLLSFRILRKEFDVKKHVPSVFIDTYHRPDDQNEQLIFSWNAEGLYDFASSVEPFECKDIEMALHEIMELQSHISKLSLENMNIEKNITAVKNEVKKLLEDQLKQQVAQDAIVFCSSNK